MLIEDFGTITCPVHGTRMEISYVNPSRKVAGYGIKQLGVYTGSCGCVLQFGTDPQLLRRGCDNGSS
jgi:hypothetical protein